MQPRNVMADWIRRINEEGRGLTTFEIAAMENITDYFDRGGKLSEKQAELVERIYVERVP